MDGLSILVEPVRLFRGRRLVIDWVNGGRAIGHGECVVVVFAVSRLGQRLQTVRGGPLVYQVQKVGPPLTVLLEHVAQRVPLVDDLHHFGDDGALLLDVGRRLTAI